MAVRSRILEGRSLASAFADFPSVFPELYCATVAAGEQAGRLDAVLERLADYTESRQQLRQKVLLTLLYPALLTVVAVLIVTGLLIHIVPQIVTVFQNVGQELPLLTRALIMVSSLLGRYGVGILIVAVMLGAGSRILLRSRAMQFGCHRMLLRIPLASRFIRTFNTAQFTRSFSILVGSGVPVLEALQVAAGVLTNLAMRQAVEKAAAQVREGAGLSKGLMQSGYFPPVTMQLIASGEASANLGEMLERAAIDQERSFETMVSVLMGIFEPLLILVMGGVVLVIVLAILLPVFDLNQLIR